MGPIVAASSPIAVVGNLNLDIKTSPLPATPWLWQDGETSVMDIYETIGGGAAHVAVAARRLGGEVWLCAAVGDDGTGRRLEIFLEETGVHPQLARKSCSTGRSVNLNWDNHNRHFVSHLPSAACLAPEDIDLAALHAAGCRQLYRGDVWFAPNMLDGGNTDLFREARRLGMQTHLDINWDPIWNSLSSETERRLMAVRETLSYVDYVHGNESELRIFTGGDTISDIVGRLFEQGVQKVILHRGAHGAAAYTAGGDYVEIPAEHVDTVACETGTGDVFSAAFLLLDRLPLESRLRQCNKIAADYLCGNLVLGRLS